MREKLRHTPVLLREAIQGLALKPGATVIDATLGSGGHFSAMLARLGQKGTLLGIDVDALAVARARKEFQSRVRKRGALTPQGCFLSTSSLPRSSQVDNVAQEVVNSFDQREKRSYNLNSTCGVFAGREHGARALFATGNFRNIAVLAEEQGITKADAILADLGWRIEQFSGDTEVGGGKGFSFAADEPLQMTFGDPVRYPFVAGDIVNAWREEDIVAVLRGYGEERYARRIARAIIERRRRKPIETSAELARIVSDAVPGTYRHGHIHPATKTFQALRIAVNDELDALKEFIESASGLLSRKGRLAIISFHSIEDRIVKHTIRTFEEEGILQRVIKKPITPTDEEVRNNPRARSARLRIAEKI